MTELYWAKRERNFSAQSRWRVLAKKLGMPAYQVIAFVNRLDEIAIAARGSVADYSAAEFSDELGMPPEEADRIFAALAAGDKPWIVDDHIVGFVERTESKADRTVKERDRRRNARDRVRAELERLADRHLISAARQRQIEQQLMTLAEEEEILALLGELGREAFGGSRQSHASHGVGSAGSDEPSHASHAWDNVGPRGPTPKEREERKIIDIDIDDGDSHASRGVGSVGSTGDDHPGEPKPPLLSKQAFALADEVCEAAGTTIDDPNMAGLAYAAQMWIERNYERALILATVAKTAKRYGNKPLGYHAKAVESAHEDAARREAARQLPLVAVENGGKHGENFARSSGRGADGRKGGFASLAVEYARRAAGGEDDGAA